MISRENQELLQQLGNTQYGVALRELLDDELAEIDTVKGISTLEETLARQKAVSLITKIFSFMEKDAPSKTKTRNNYV